MRESSDTASFSFVGVRRNPSDGVLELWLPHGFGTFPKADYSETTRIFFALYRALKKFAATGRLQEERPDQVRDPLGERLDEGAAHRAQLFTEQLTFSRVARLERVMSEFTEALMRSLIARSFPRPPTSFESIHKSLHTALFSDDHSFFLPEVRQPTLGLGVIRTDLIELASFIYREILSWTYGPSSVPVHIAHAASVFREAHLSSSSGLFSEDSFEEVLRVLRRELQVVHKRTVYRDEDFWRIFEAVEVFLYGDLTESDGHGDEWGISDFHPVWEDMCHAFMSEKSKFRGDLVLFSDGQRRLNNFADRGPFVLRWGTHSRWLAPDFVLRQTINAERARREHIDIKVVPVNHGFFELTVRKLGKDDSVYLALKRIILKNLAGGKITDLSRTSFRPSKPLPSILWHKIDEKITDFFSTQERRRNSGSFIIDFKYMPLSDFSTGSLSTKARDDIDKSLAYELALTNRKEIEGTTLKNQFVVPYYFSLEDQDREYSFAVRGDSKGEYESIVPHPVLLNSGMDLVKLNFLRALQSYAPPSDVDG